MKNVLGRFAQAVRRMRGGGEAKPVQTAHAIAQPNELEHKLAEAAVDPAKRAAFQQLLLKSDIYAVTPSPPPTDASGMIPAGTDLALRNVPAPDGSQVAAIFTSEARIAETFGPGVSFVRIQGQALLEIVAQKGAFLNPGSQFRVHWDPAGIAGVLGRPFTYELTKPTKLLLATPSQPPTALIAQLRDILGSRADVPDAWFALAQWPEKNEYAWYLDVRTKLEHAQVVELLSDIFNRGPFEGRPLDMIIRDPAETPGVGIRIAPGVAH
jgi:type III secretion system (T3SS) SseB-like protein